MMNMTYKITDLIESDSGCEGFMPGEEPMVTLILTSDNCAQIKVQLPNLLAYQLKWDVGATITEEDIEKHCK